MTIIAELHQDHVNLNKLLLMLKGRVDQIREGEQPNFALVQEVIEYIAVYADGFHHPREDKLYQYFAGRNPVLDRLFGECQSEHQGLKEASAEVMQAAESVLQGSVLPIAEFADSLMAFINLQLEHLSLEERKVFPLLEEVATSEDWSDLQKQLPAPEDPLFGNKQAHQFSELYKELILDEVYA